MNSQATHEVINQPPVRTGIDEYETNPPLREAVHRYGAAFAEEELHEIGRLVGSERYQRWAEVANTNKPVLHTHDRYGHRIDEVSYDPAYHEIISRSVAYGAHSSAVGKPAAGRERRPRRGILLFNQVEPGHCCPISMTYSALPTLRHQPEIAAQWEPLLVKRGYDPRLAPPADKPGVLFGMAMTEKQGGSDVRANTTRAEPVAVAAWRGVPAHRAQVVLLGPDVRRLPGAGAERPTARTASCPASWCPGSCPTAPATCSASSG